MDSLISQSWPPAEWLAGLTDWIDERLAAAGIRRRGPVTLARAWSRAVVVTLETERGRLWAKAVPEVFAHEIALTELLSDIDPGIVPPVVAADRELGRIITEHVEGPILMSLGDRPEVWAATFERLAEIQRVLANETDALTTAGVVAAPLAQLAGAIPTLLADDDLLQVDRPGGLTSGEATTLRRRTSELVDACLALDASGVPDSLEHGALASDEVIVGEMGPVFLDWSDGSITHPFLSAASLLGDLAAPAGDDADLLVAAYLGPWLSGGFGLSEPAARSALRSARSVLPLHVASLHAGRVLPALDPSWPVDDVVPRVLRTILPG